MQKSQNPFFKKNKWVRHKNNFPNFNNWKKWGNCDRMTIKEIYDRENIVSYIIGDRDGIN